MAPKIHPVILCGGSGTRLWPLSRKSYPKQFSQLIGDTTLFQQSVQRIQTDAFANPTILTNSDFRFIVTQQLAEIGASAQSILIEPEGKNTGPAILAAALHLQANDPGALMLVMPSDHVIRDIAAFHDAIEIAAQVARGGDLVTFGIHPTHPETGYGYLELGASDTDNPDAPRLKRFVEKPDLATAQNMLAAGGFLWNAGIFLFSASAIVAAFDAHAPQLGEGCRLAVAEAKSDLGFTRLEPSHWGALDNISIDFAVMELATNLRVVPLSCQWSDLGDWQAVWTETRDQPSLNATAIDCTDTLLRSESEGLEIVGIGLDNIVAIAMPDAVIVADKSRTQDVKLAVEHLKAKSAPQAEQFPRDHRPWGWFESLSVGNRFQVKRIMVHPGAALSLQSHVHRSEHWIVVQGTAKVTIDEAVQLVSENQSIYVPVGSKHRMENPGKVDLHLIEVQTGSYLGEDDITRYEDVYSRD